MKNGIFLIFFCLIALSTQGAQLSEHEARKKAQRFLQGKQFGNVMRQRAIKRSQVLQDKNFYIFNVEQNGGFVIVSGDDRTTDILGYSDVGSIEQDNIPENLSWWLNEYGRQIEFIKKTSESANDISGLSEPALPPLIATHWDQTVNILCPQYTPTGCVATAMAQIMYYHRWPEIACKAIPGYTTDTYGYELSELPSTIFRWDLMLDEYIDFIWERYDTPNENDQAIAELMRYCGQSVRMDYKPSGAGASLSDAAEALKTYFDYSSKMRRIDRDGYSCTQWESVIYQEIANNRPVLYKGSPTLLWHNGIGHAFVCDGFDGDGRFHINWGWGGTCDGFFVLSVLNNNYPDGAMSNGGYSFFQEAVIGIEPNDGSMRGPELWIKDIHAAVDSCTRGSLSEDFAPVGVQVDIDNRGDLSFNGFIGFAIYSNNVLIEYKDGKKIGLEPSQNIVVQSDVLLTKELMNGEYAIKAVYKTDEDDSWKEILGRPILYFTVSDTLLSFKTYDSATRLRVDSVGIEGHLAKGMDVTAIVKITNVGGSSENWVIVAFGGSSDLINVAIDPNESSIYRVRLRINEVGEQNLVVSYFWGGNVICSSTYTVNTPIPHKLEGSLNIDGLVDDGIDGNRLTGTLSVKNTGQEIYSDELVVTLDNLMGDSKSIQLVEYMNLQPDGTEEIPFSVDYLETGSYRMTCHYYSADDNGNCLSVVLFAQDINIKGPKLVLKAIDDVRTYGEENPVFKYEVEEGSLDGIPNIYCEATSTSPVGTYDILVSQGSVKNNNVIYVAGTLTVIPATLTASVGKYIREQGKENPEFVIVYNGWKNGENEGVLLSKPVAETTALKDSPVGEYPITISGGDAQNYKFEYVNGTLTVIDSSGIDDLLASGKPFDVYTIVGVPLRRQVRTVEGLSSGVYIINGQKIIIK